MQETKTAAPAPADSSETKAAEMVVTGGKQTVECKSAVECKNGPNRGKGFLVETLMWITIT